MDEYVTSYFVESKNTVISTVKVAKIVLDVYNKYSAELIEKNDFDYFCKQVNLNPTSSQFRKYLCIADKAERIEQYIDDMPSAVSVIYKITTLDDEKFDALIESDELNKKMTLSKLNSLFPVKERSAKVKKIEKDEDSEFDFVINITFEETGIVEDKLKAVSNIRDFIKTNTTCSSKLLVNGEVV